MNASKLSFLILSLPAVAALFPYSAANAALRISNSSLVKEQAQINASRAAEMMPMEPQPARVFTNDNGETISVSNEDMDACNEIYPNGQFDWLKPTTGSRRGGPATCVAFIELRAYKNSAGTEYTTLATAYLAAGDSMRCNIDDFHDVTLQGRDYTYPADAEPTIQDVEKVMAEENKSNAGFKILAATLVGGIGGNLVGKGEAGSESPFGVTKDKLKTTAMGAAAGAALMTASTQVNDYKAGSIILSTGVNAAAGAAAGNLMASGEDVLKIDNCKLYRIGKDGNTTDEQYDAYCLRGTMDLDEAKDAEEIKGDGLFFNLDNRYGYQCTEISDDPGHYNGCSYIALKDVKFVGVNNSDKCPETGAVTQDCITFLKDNVKDKDKRYKYNDPEKQDKLKGDANGEYIKIASAKKARARVGAMIEVSEVDAKKFFGYKYSQWSELKKTLAPKIKKKEIYIRDMQGKPIVAESGVEISIDSFYPAAQSADDGTMLDFNNKARTKSTLIGTGGGAALGALSGASGADAAIQERWTAAVREYKDSLSHVSCSTGNRYLAPYNTVIVLPEMKKSE